MSGSRFVMPNQFFVTTAGNPAVGYLLYFYQTGTNSPQNTYADAAFTTPNSNPITADANGDFGNIFLLSTPNYRVTLTDPNGVQIWTMDPVGPNAGLGSGASIPIGGMIAYGGTAAPSGYHLCDGSAVSRTTFAGLFAVIGTAYGTGDGSTTFNLPDKRGRVSIGKDDMGGSAANRVTNGGSGITGTTLGASGGNQLTQTHTHAVTDPTHTHTVTDPNHHHQETFNPNAFGQTAGPGAAGTATGGPTASALNTADAATGVTIAAASTGITIASYGSGTSQNMPPGQIDNWIIRVS